MNQSIKGVLFDIGGVLVALDGVPSLARLLDVENDHEQLHALWLTSPAVKAHETGKIDAATFAAGVVADLKLPTTADSFLQDFSRWPTAVLPGALELLDEVPPALQLAALSNTSVVHWERIAAMGLTDRFTQMYLSFEIGHLKPAVEAFEIARAGMELPPNEILFLDDGERNVSAAQMFGMHAHVARGPAEARRILMRYGVL